MTTITTSRWINRGDSLQPIDTKKVEQLKNAKYIGDFCIKNSMGNWGETPVQIYYVDTVNDPAHSNYFGMFARGNDVYITNGISTANIEITAVESPDGEIIYSRFRHDYRATKDGTTTIDGGRDYTRSSSPANFLTLMIVDGEIVIKNEDGSIEKVDVR